MGAVTQFQLKMGLTHSPYGIALRANNSILVESVFHGASRKGAKDAKNKQE